MKSSFGIAANHQLLMAIGAGVAAAVRQRASVETGSVKDGPADKTEIGYALQIGEEASRLGPVTIRVLALMSRN